MGRSVMSTRYCKWWKSFSSTIVLLLGSEGLQLKILKDTPLKLEEAPVMPCNYSLREVMPAYTLESDSHFILVDKRNAEPEE